MPPRATSLQLYEEILLLALKEEKGTFHWKTYRPALGAGLIAELLLRKRVEIEDSKRKLVTVIDSSATGDAVLDRFLGEIQNSSRRRKLGHWVSLVQRKTEWSHDIAKALCRKGILREEEDRVLALFRRRTYPEVDPRPERELIARMRKAIFGSSRTVDPRTVILISLAKSADLLTVAFEKQDLKERKARIKQLVDGELLGRASQEAVDATNAAVMVATIIPAVVVTTS